VSSLNFSLNAQKVLERRYLLKDEHGEVVETPEEMFSRVSRCVASAQGNYGGEPSAEEVAERFYEAMVRLEFLPNSPTLMNAGTDIGQLSACFVLPVEDSMEGIFGALHNMALIHQSGGGTGFSFSRLRPRSDVVRSTRGIASGPISFMRVFDVATDVVKQGGRRRGANMGILRADHPDILDFVRAKGEEGYLANFNLSVGITDDFVDALRRKDTYPLVNPRTKEVVRRLSAEHLFETIVEEAWKTGDPGLILLDEINRAHATRKLGAIEATNPCGEQPLLPYESCNLGSINLSKMIRGRTIDWEKLKETVHVAVNFLDNVIDVNKFPVAEIEDMTKATRRIGLGIMGFAEALILLGVPYASDEALRIGEEITKFMFEEAKGKSIGLAHTRGSFPRFKESLWEKRGVSAIRNTSLITVAPTGTIGIVAGTSSGIEPLFAISFIREVMEGTKLFEVNPLFGAMAEERGIYRDDLIRKVAEKGSIQDLEEVPQELKSIFLSAFDIPPQWHVRMQAAFQKHTDNAVSKTINLKESAGKEEVEKAFLTAFDLRCKGITVFRYGCKKQQVLYLGKVRENPRGPEYLKAGLEDAGECMICTE
jgi:ribonucleoside-diphosphate reductase alpha chain